MNTLLGGILLPESVLHSQWYAILATFVAINTLIYVTLGIAKMLPKAHPHDWWWRVRGRGESTGRKEDRSIYPPGYFAHPAGSARQPKPTTDS